MKLLHTLSRVASSASELTETLDLVVALRELGVQNGIAAAEDNLPAITARLGGDVPLYPLRFPRGARPGNLRDARDLSRIATDYDLIHAHLAHDHWLAALATRKPLVRSRHTLARARGHFFNRWLFVRRTAALIGISHRALVSYGILGVPMERMYVIPGGVDGTRFRPGIDGTSIRASLHIPPQAVVVGIVAKLREVKGHADLLAALATLREPAPEWRLLVVGGKGGGGAAGKTARRVLHALQEKAAALGIADRIHWLGRRDDVPEVMAACDLGVLAAHRSHGATRAGLEWAASGKALIATRVGVLDEYFADGRDAILVPPKSPDRLGQALGRLLSDASFRDELGDSARRTAVGNHLWPDLARKTLEVYQNAAG